jgi:pentatricopeptide repeat protein
LLEKRKKYKLSKEEYNDLLLNLCKSGELDLAAHYFNEMKSKNINIKEGPFRYLIIFTCKAGKVAQSINYFEEYTSRYNRILIDFYRQLVNLILHQNDPVSAMKIVDHYFNTVTGQQLSAPLLEPLLTFWLKEGNVDEMERVYQKFKKDDRFKVSLRTYDYMHDAHIQAAKYHENMAKYYYEEMIRLFNSSPSDEVTQEEIISD